MKNNIIISVSVLVILLIGIGVGHTLSTPHARGYSGFAGKNNFENGRMMKGGYMMVGHMMDDNYRYATGTDSMGMNMSDMMGQMNLSLKGKTGDEFDQAFLTEMIVHHQGAVQMAELALKQSKHQEIKNLAQAIITAQNKEIADMKVWLKTWYNK